MARTFRRTGQADVRYTRPLSLCCRGAVDEGAPAKQERAHEVLRSARNIVISTQVLSEFYVIVTRKLAKPALHDAAAVFENMITYICISKGTTFRLVTGLDLEMCAGLAEPAELS